MRKQFVFDTCAFIHLEPYVIRLVLLSGAASKGKSLNSVFHHRRIGPLRPPARFNDKCPEQIAAARLFRTNTTRTLEHFNTFLFTFDYFTLYNHKTPRSESSSSFPHPPVVQMLFFYFDCLVCASTAATS